MKPSTENIRNHKLSFEIIKNSLRRPSRFSLRVLFSDPSPGIVNRYMRHMIAGGFGVLIYTGLIAFCVEIIGLHPVSAAVFSTSLVALYTYAIQRLWVYNSNSSHFRAVPKFIIVGMIAVLLNSGVMFLVVEIFHWWYGLGIVCAAAIVPPTNFLLHYYWTYR
jgi:putative flippase GtrA